MSITEILDSLTILNDETTNLNIVNYCFCILLITIMISFISIIFVIIKEYLCKYFDGELLFVCIILFAFCVIIATILYSILSTPVVNIYLIISTDNVDKTTLYEYFNISEAPINNTVKISPKSEFFNESLDWYNLHFTK